MSIPEIEKQKMAEFKEVSKPLIKWLNDNFCPHVVAIVETDCVRLYDGMMSIKNDEFIKD